MNYVFAGLILIVWIYIVMSFAWSPDASPKVNLTLGILVLLLIGLVHWLPFWLIFMK